MKDLPITDKNGLTLSQFLQSYNADKYPKPSLTADNVIFAKSDDEFFVLLIKRAGHPFLGYYALPGGFANKNEELIVTAARELSEETGIKNLVLHSVSTYSKPERDPRGWVVSQAFYSICNKKDVVPKAADDAKAADWFGITVEKSKKDVIINLVSKKDTIKISLEKSDCEYGFIAKTDGILAFDHAQIIADALVKAEILK